MTTFNRRWISLSSAAAAAGLTFLLATLPARADTATDVAVERGAYLVRIGGCNDCHTPLMMGPQGPQPDFARALSGHPHDLKMPPAPQLGAGAWQWAGAVTNTAFAGPWGVSYAMNLTPDKTTGLGLWTEQQFVATLRTGRHLGVSRPVLPPMPIGATSQMTDADLKSIYAYLRTLPAIHNRVPDPTPPAAQVAEASK